MADARRRTTPETKETKEQNRPQPFPRPRENGKSSLASLYGALALLGIAAVAYLYFTGTSPFQTSPSLNSAPSVTPLKSASSSTAPERTADLKHFTDAGLRDFDGSNPDTPIYLGINGTVYDVTAGRNFYGPGGHYGHFAGRDATRAWVTECWDTEDQLTHDMRGIEDMFMPRYIDEEMEDAANGKGSLELPEAVRTQAKQRLSAFGTVSEEERAERREADRVEALERVETTLGTWVKFFAGSGKYPVVGQMLRSEESEKALPEPPAFCEKALKKRPMKGGKLQAMMDAKMNMGEAAGGKGGGETKGEMPDFVKEKLGKQGIKS